MEETTRHLDARHLLLAAAIGVFFAITAISASFAAAGNKTGVTIALGDAPPARCSRHYAGHCTFDDPCYRADLKNWRYGDERDFACFIYQRN